MLAIWLTLCLGLGGCLVLAYVLVCVCLFDLVLGLVLFGVMLIVLCY